MINLINGLSYLNIFLAFWIFDKSPVGVLLAIGAISGIISAGILTIQQFDKWNKQSDYKYFCQAEIRRIKFLERSGK